MIYDGARRKYAGSFSEFFEHEGLLETFAISGEMLPESMNSSTHIELFELK